MFIDFAKGFRGEPDFDWRGYAEWLLQALNHKTGQAWILEQENLRLREALKDHACHCTERCRYGSEWQRIESCPKFRAARLLQPAKETP